MHGQGKLEEAKQCYQVILSIQPNHTDAITMLGIAYFNKVSSKLVCLSYNGHYNLITHNLKRILTLVLNCAHEEELLSYNRAIADGKASTKHYPSTPERLHVLNERLFYEKNKKT